MKWLLKLLGIRVEKTPPVLRENPYNHSHKQFVVMRIVYQWDKYARKLSNAPIWRPYKSYKTLNSALDAVRDFRNSWYDKAYYDYPALFEGVSNEKKYPEITPTISIWRYKIVPKEEIINKACLKE